MRQRDPLPRIQACLVEMGVPESELSALDAEILRELEADQAWALEQPFPTVEQATDHVIVPLEG